MTDEEIKSKAVEFAKKNKVSIARKLTDPLKYAPEINPISVFMAGSPGAGKTEFSKNLIDILEEDKEHRVIRIDGDEVRPLIPEYIGSNSYLFQGAISLVVEKMQDIVLHQKQNFVLDSTFSRYKKAADNLSRSLEKMRPTFIFYIYQKPEVAWKFTQAREKAEGRKIPKSAFIEEFLGARETVDKILHEFGSKVTVFFVKKDFEKNTVENLVKIDSVKNRLDYYISERYDVDNLEKLL